MCAYTQTKIKFKSLKALHYNSHKMFQWFRHNILFIHSSSSLISHTRHLSSNTWFYRSLFHTSFSPHPRLSNQAFLTSYSTTRQFIKQLYRRSVIFLHWVEQLIRGVPNELQAR